MHNGGDNSAVVMGPIVVLSVLIVLAFVVAMMVSILAIITV